MLNRLFRSARIFRKPVESATQSTGRKNVYVNLMGGLGNQLFQYAFAHFLIKNAVSIAGLLANHFDHDAYRRAPLIDAISRIPVLKIPTEEYRAIKILADEDGEAVKELLLAGNFQDLLCRGYWQDARYVEQVRQEVSGDLLACYERSYRAANDLDNECVLHVRRNDYGHNGLLPVSYYLGALEECGWPEFFVVTDEPNFCEYVFRKTRGFGGVISSSPSTPWPDFYFMFRSRIQVVANSSFSWWTAWLGRAAGVTRNVFAPAEWSILVRNQPCPGDWERIETKLLRP